MNRSLIDETEMRRHDLHAAEGHRALHTLRRPSSWLCEVLDLSVSGVSLKTDVRPPIGEFVLIGQMAGRVARHHEQGIGIEFVGGSPVSADRLHAKAATGR